MWASLASSAALVDVRVVQLQHLLVRLGLYPLQLRQRLSRLALRLGHRSCLRRELRVLGLQGRVLGLQGRVLGFQRELHCRLLLLQIVASPDADFLDDGSNPFLEGFRNGLARLTQKTRETQIGEEHCLSGPGARVGSIYMSLILVVVLQCITHVLDPQ